MSHKDEIVLYQPDHSIQLEVRVEDETVWLTQEQMSILFNRDRTLITRNINNIFNEGELEEKSNVHFLHIANSDKPIKAQELLQNIVSRENSGTKSILFKSLPNIYLI
ncbi:MAG: hypothetical protein EZS26_003066 [Candidatus Ordinivivax streblomastigis]|uniref:Uncharacterized protein n=1 Tax=Candidatus Ordinivivax streblomastigis TaxID=2540710 RepID=A0A5M8NXY4_9BACT|nr:MAG: hypothetical protein EZS26_003066 [Candidatus Ordinivivax streblomastigis]